MNEPRRNKSSRNRRRGGGAAKARQGDLWAPVPALADPVPIEPSTDPRMLLRSLGDPPLSGQGAVAEHYLGAVVDRASGLATALAAAAGLLGEAATDE